jgi:ubiquinone/menaquinone biosynthesis C-methylase UbiE
LGGLNKTEIRWPAQAVLVQEVQRYFAGAAEYAQLYEGSGSCARFFNQRLRIAMGVIGNLRRGKVLDVGCGPGILLSRMASTHLDLYGVDCSPEMIAEAKKRTPATRAGLMVGTAEELPFEDQTFDAVFALGVLEYLQDVSRGLHEIARVAKSNALVVVSMMNAQSLYMSWERLIYSSANDSWLQCQLGKKQKSLLRLRGRKTLSNIMSACDLEPVDVKYYDVNVCVPPLDTKYPRKTKLVNQWIETHLGPWPSSLLHTAFILTAKRRQRLTKAA